MQRTNGGAGGTTRIHRPLADRGADLASAKAYQDGLMPLLGLRAWFPTTADGIFNYGPDGPRGPRLFFSQAL